MSKKTSSIKSYSVLFCLLSVQLLLQVKAGDDRRIQWVQGDSETVATRVVSFILHNTLQTGDTKASTHREEDQKPFSGSESGQLYKTQECENRQPVETEKENQLRQQCHYDLHYLNNMKKQTNSTCKGK